MCIFSYDATVSDTRILVMPLEGNRQLTVYENFAINNGTKVNAMILPVCNTTQHIQLLDFSDYRDIWDDCEKYFPAEVSKGFSFGGGTPRSANTSTSFLPVQRVGGYSVSIAPSIEDIKRVNSDQFILPPGIEGLLQQHYAKGFAFIVCMFDKVTQGHPIAYISDMNNNTLFVPTRHEHGNERERVAETFNRASNFQSPSSDKEHPGVYCDECGSKNKNISGSRWKCCNCADFDLCDACYKKRRHTRAHVFVELPHHVMDNVALVQKHYSMMPLVYTGSSPDSRFGEPTNATYDHTIYLVNAVFATPIKATQKQALSKQQHFRWFKVPISFDVIKQVRKFLFSDNYPDIDCVNKVVLKGLLENRDCFCAVSK